MTPEISSAQYIKPALWGGIIVLILAIAAWYAFTSDTATPTTIPTPTPNPLEQGLEDLNTTNLDDIDKDLEAITDETVQF